MSPRRRTLPPRFGVVLARVVACAALAGGTGVALSPPAPAYAAAAGSTCPAIDVPSSTKAAMAVFEGTVDGEPTASAKPDGSRGAVYLHTVTVQTVFQGRIRTSSAQVQTDRTPKTCSLSALTPGRTYVFFVQGDGDPWVAVSGAGTAPATATLVAGVESILGRGRPPVQPTPEEARFTSLDPAPPQTLTRAAAPGVALVLVGLLGLLVVRGKRARRR